MPKSKTVRRPSSQPLKRGSPAKKIGSANSASSRKKPAAKRKSKEKGLQYRCQQWLEQSGILAQLLIFHVPNERIGGMGAVMHFKRMGVLAGVADYLAFPTSRAVAIELKDEDEDPRATQEAFQRRWERAGNTYFIARTLEQFQGIIDALTLFQPKTGMPST